jgi:acetyltransferase-like isoleucine patch superfamily enzyme
MIHPTADVKSKEIGYGTQVWQYSIVLEGARIGDNCNINCHVFIENDVIIGDNVTIKTGVQLWDGLRIEDEVFIGPNVTFTNDQRPRSKQYSDTFQKTFIKKKASIGGGSVVLGGVSIGKFAMVGAGAVVTKNVSERALVVGNPARIVGWLNNDGSKMESIEENLFEDSHGNRWRMQNDKLIPL